MKLFKKIKTLLFLIILLSTTNCKNEDLVENIEEVEQINFKIDAETVSVENAKSIFNNSELRKKRTAGKNVNELTLSVDWNTVTQIPVNYTDALLTKVDVQINREGNYSSQIYFININGKPRNIIVTIFTSKKDDKNNILDAYVFLNNLDGQFIDAYKIENGLFSKKVIPKIKIRTANKLAAIEEDDDNYVSLPFWWWCFVPGQDEDYMFGLDEVVINANPVDGQGGGGGGTQTTTYSPSNSNFSYGSLMNNSYGSNSNYYGSNNGFDSPSFDSGGGIRPHAISSGVTTAISLFDEEEDLAQETPCKQIKTLITNAAFADKMNELNKLTNKKEETGYAQNKNGTFTKLPVINKGHSLSLDKIKFSEVNGFIHTHLNDFPTGKIDETTGNPKINEIYRIFSPADVIAFLKIVKASSDVSKTYASVITSTGNYTLKFTGDVNDIKGLKKAKYYKADYIEMMKKGKEKGFLHFLQNHIKIDGIELYKLHKPLFSSTIKIQKKSLNLKGSVDKTECE